MTVLLEKRCSKCCSIKSIDHFFRNHLSRDGRQSHCKECTKKYEQSVPVVVQTKKMFNKARNRAKNKGLAFDIDVNYIRSIIPTHCAVLGVKLEWSTHRGNGTNPLPNSPSLDRIDPTKGYIKGNVWIISHRANIIKSDASHEELKLVTEAVGRAIVDSLDW